MSGSADSDLAAQSSPVSVSAIASPTAQSDLSVPSIESPELFQRRLLSQIAESRESLLDRSVSFSSSLDAQIAAHQRLTLELEQSIKHSHSYLVQLLKRIQRLESSIKGQDAQFDRESRRFRSGNIQLKWQQPSHFHVACIDYVKHIKAQTANAVQRGSASGPVKLPNQLLELSQSIRGHLRVFAAFQSGQRSIEEVNQILMDSKRVQEKEKRKLVGFQGKLNESKAVLKELKLMKSELEARHGAEIERFLKRKEEKMRVKEMAAQQLILRVKEIEKQMRLVEEQAEREEEGKENNDENENITSNNNEEKNEKRQNPAFQPLASSLRLLGMGLGAIDDSMPSGNLFQFPDSLRPNNAATSPQIPKSPTSPTSPSYSLAPLSPESPVGVSVSTSVPSPESPPRAPAAAARPPEYLEIKKKFFSSLNVARSTRPQSSLAVSSFRSDASQSPTSAISGQNRASPTRIAIAISPPKDASPLEQESKPSDSGDSAGRSSDSAEDDSIEPESPNLKSPPSAVAGSTEKQPWWKALFNSKEKEKEREKATSVVVDPELSPAAPSPFRWLFSLGSKKPETLKSPLANESTSSPTVAPLPEPDPKPAALRLLDEDFTSPGPIFPSTEQYCVPERQELELLLKGLEKLNFSQQRAWEELERILDQRENMKMVGAANNERNAAEAEPVNASTTEKTGEESKEGSSDESASGGSNSTATGVRRALFPFT